MELPQCGQPCCHDECRRLDFLPYRCRLCSLLFCDEHIRSHGCVFRDEQNENKDLPIPQKKVDNSTKCEEEGCKDTRSHMLIKCKDCEALYCVAHRHITCPKIAVPVGPPESVITAADMYKYAKEAVDQQVNLNIEKARKKSKNAEMANKVQLMRLKSKAIGLPSIPAQDRAYFLVRVGKEKNEKQDFPLFVSCDWTVGRSVDAIAATCKVKNQNNLANAPKLKLFRNSDSQVLTENLAEKITDLFNRGIICNGETLFMDYV